MTACWGEGFGELTRAERVRNQARIRQRIRCAVRYPLYGYPVDFRDILQFETGHISNGDRSYKMIFLTHENGQPLQRSRFDGFKKI